MREFLAADRFFFASHVEDKGYLEIVDGKFGQYYKTLPDEKVNIIDQSGKWIAPGLVDTHIHGFKNHDVMDNDAQGMNEISEGLLSCGVTSFLPTTLTSSRKHLKDVAKMLGEVKGSEKGAKIQGIYFEGPFFTEEHK
ncbi:MAG: amidohydrolase family protein, partial [Tetragenococcus halophilus]|nr:amidohydrolase family protein [Tetragenococcus halophilus]MDN6711740.1 amidohydrolase family protein [Tetragenococcus halophilus]